MNQLSLGDDGSPGGGRGVTQGNASAQHKRYKLLHKSENTQDCVSNEQNHTSNHNSTQVVGLINYYIYFK